MLSLVQMNSDNQNIFVSMFPFIETSSFASWHQQYVTIVALVRVLFLCKVACDELARNSTELKFLEV